MLSPCPSGTGLEAQLHGDLLAILKACAEVDPKRRQPASLEAGCELSLVAGARNQRFLRLIEAAIPKLAA